MSEPTQKGHTRSVRMLVDFYGKTPDLISEQELQDYFLHHKHVLIVGANWRFAAGYIRSSPGLLSTDDAELVS
jgi:hypothetical protein